MRKAWTHSFVVALCAASFAASLAVADPASWAMRPQPAPGASNSSIWPWARSATPAAPPQAVVAQPIEKVSPLRHPVQYLKNATASKGKAASSQHATMPPADSRRDPLSLSTPTGPPTPEFFIFAAQMCERQGDILQARKNYQRALSMWPGHVEVLRSAARMEDRQSNLPLAENLYGQAVHSNPQHAGALNDLGLCLARQGKLDPSVQVLEQAIQLQPTKALYRNNAATVLVELRQDQRALAHLAAVHGPAEANYNLGQLLVERGRPNDAVPYFQAALQQNPGMQPAQDALAKLQGNRMAAAKPRVITVPVTAPPTAPPATTSASVAAPPAVTTPATPAAQVATQLPVAAQPPAAVQTPTATVQTPTVVAQAPAAPQSLAATPAPVSPQVPVVAQNPAAAPSPTTAATVAPTPQYVPPVASRPTTSDIVR